MGEVSTRTQLEKKILRKEILCFSLLHFGMSTMGNVISTALNLYFTDVLGLSLAMVGIVLSVTKIWDAVNDPLMGIIVDKTHTKWGKCRPYAFWLAAPVILAMAVLFAPVNFGSNGNFIYAIIAYLVYYTIYTALDIPFQGMIPLVFPEDKKRVKAISISNVLGSLGTILPSILFFTIAGLFGRSNEKVGYFSTALIFAVISGFLIFIAPFGFKEKIYIPPKREKYTDGLRTVLKDKNFIAMTCSVFFCAVVNLGAMFLPYFAKWNCIGVIPIEQLSRWIELHFGISISLTGEGLLTPILQIGSGISYMLSMLLVPYLLKKFTKKQLLIGVSLIGGVVDGFVFFIGVYMIPYNTVAGVVAYTVLRFFTNFPVGITTVLLLAMFSDIIDDIELRTGKRLEGTVFSFKSLVNKIAVAVFNVFVLNVVDYFGYNADTMKSVTDNVTKALISSTTQASVVNGVNYTTLLNVIFFMLTGLGAVGLFLQAVPIFFYRLDEKSQAENQNQAV